MARIIDTFSPLVAPACPGVSEMEIRRAVVDAARDFFDRTSSWEALFSTTTTANDPALSLDVPAGAEVARVLFVGLGGSELILAPTSAVTMPAALAQGVGAPSYGTPLHAYFGSGSDADLLLYPIPDRTIPMVVRVCCIPTRNADTLPDALLVYAEDLASGAKARLMQTPGASFASPAYKLFEAQFEVAVGRARREAMTGRVRTSLSVRRRSFV